MGRISDMKELRLEILRRRSLASHQEQNLKQDWTEIKNTVSKYNYAAKVADFFSSMKSGNSGNVFADFLYRGMDKAFSSGLFNKMPWLFRKFSAAFVRAEISGLKNKVSGLWKQFSGFFRKD
jgi:hypothetical protein